MSGNISPMSNDIDETNNPTSSGSFMLPPPMIAVPSGLNSGHGIPSASPSVRSATPYPSRAESCDSFGLPTLSTPLQWEVIEKIRI